MAVNAKGEEITSIWTPANIITCVRIAFIPLFMIASEVSFAVAQQSYDSSIATAAAWEHARTWCRRRTRPAEDAARTSSWEAGYRPS